MDRIGPTQPALFPSPADIRGNRVLLSPMNLSHVDSLWAVGNNSSVWEMSPWPILDRSDMSAYVAKAMLESENRTSAPFVTTELSTDRIIGSTRFMNIDAKNRRLEIGCTWIGPEWQRTGLNREAKYLMLSYAFDSLGYDRVEFKTDMSNVQSRTAIEKLGAQQEGILRRHVVTRSGRVRDTVYFSILRDEWPEISSRLAERLSRT